LSGSVSESIEAVSEESRESLDSAGKYTHLLLFALNAAPICPVPENKKTSDYKIYLNFTSLDI
jgi:hypothetical protein